MGRPGSFQFRESHDVHVFGTVVQPLAMGRCGVVGEEQSHGCLRLRRVAVSGAGCAVDKSFIIQIVSVPYYF